METPPGPPGPRSGPAGYPHLAKQPSQTLAVELHLQPGPGAGFHDRKSWTFFRVRPWTEAGEDQTSREVRGPAPSQAPKSTRVQHLRLSAARPGVASLRQGEPRAPSETGDSQGTSTQLAGRKLGEICKERNRKTPRRSRKGGRSN